MLEVWFIHTKFNKLPTLFGSSVRRIEKEMTMFEYKVVLSDHALYSWSLTDLGQEGWELVSVIRSGVHNKREYYFKRKIQDYSVS